MLDNLANDVLKVAMLEFHAGLGIGEHKTSRRKCSGSRDKFEAHLFQSSLSLPPVAPMTSVVMNAFL